MVEYMLTNKESLNPDKHIRVLESIVGFLKKEFPDSAIGISGSVANRKHKPDSDIDLLLLNRSFKRHRQCSFFLKEEVDVNILCLNPDELMERIEKWMIQFDDQHINYIVDSEILQDKNSILKDLQNLLRDKIEIIKKSDKTLLSKFYDRLDANDINITHLKKSINSRSELIKRLNMLVSLWFLENGIKNRTKNDDRNSMRTINIIDSRVYKGINSIILNNYLNNEKIQQLQSNLMRSKSK